MKKHVLLGVTGSVAIYKSADLIRRLQEKNIDVQVVMSPHAKHFMTPLIFETLTQKKVIADMFDVPTDFDMEHIALSKWADLFLIAPITANMISKIACGLADDIVSATAMTIKKPIVMAPAMNTDMWTNPIVQEHMKKLSSLGVHMIEPQCKTLAVVMWVKGL